MQYTAQGILVLRQRVIVFLAGWNLKNQKILKVCQKHEVTYEKRRRTKFQSREKNEEVIPPRIDGRDADVQQVSSNNHLLSHSAQQCDTFQRWKVGLLF
jgi:hypothetical protein